jgi:hypothetical protein
MSQIWTGAFWKDTGERVLGTALAGVAAILAGEVVPGVPDTTLKAQAIGLGLLCLATLVKCMLAGLSSPNTGASFGTAVPADQTRAVVDVTSATAPGTVISLKTEQPVQVLPRAA